MLWAILLKVNSFGIDEEVFLEKVLHFFFRNLPDRFNLLFAQIKIHLPLG
jgi:hypothetical protein